MPRTNRPHIMIFSPCVFTRFGLERVLTGALPHAFQDSIVTLPAVLHALDNDTQVHTLVLHVSALIYSEEWRKVDDVFRLQSNLCQAMILVDQESISALDIMPSLVAQARLLIDSSVTQAELAVHLISLVSRSYISTEAVRITNM